MPGRACPGDPAGWHSPRKPGKLASLRGAVAQLGERRVRNAKVGSSILLRSTTYSKARSRGPFSFRDFRNSLAPSRRIFIRAPFLGPSWLALTAHLRAGQWASAARSVAEVASPRRSVACRHPPGAMQSVWHAISSRSFLGHEYLELGLVVGDVLAMGIDPGRALFSKPKLDVCKPEVGLQRHRETSSGSHRLARTDLRSSACPGLRPLPQRRQSDQRADRRHCWRDATKHRRQQIPLRNRTKFDLIQQRLVANSQKGIA